VPFFFFYVRYSGLPHRQSDDRVGAVALQAPLQVDKTTLAGETTEDLLAIETRQHHGDEALSLSSSVQFLINCNRMDVVRFISPGIYKHLIYKNSSWPEKFIAYAFSGHSLMI
jgi:hypothetical protein